jgi:hypothetical protein
MERFCYGQMARLLRLCDNAVGWLKPADNVTGSLCPKPAAFQLIKLYDKTATGKTG